MTDIDDPHDHFWAQYHQLLAVSPTAQLDELDAAFTKALNWLGSHLAGPLGDLDSLQLAISLLLNSHFFQNLSQRSASLIILLLADPMTPLSNIFIACYALLINGTQNPVFFRSLRTLAVSFSTLVIHSSSPAPAEISKVIPVILAAATRVGLVPTHAPTLPDDRSFPVSPDDKFAERRLGPLFSGLLYELCRVQKLEPELLGLFSEELIDHLFELVELTRDQEDETLNYNLIKLIIALNEQFMVAGLHHQPASVSTEPSRTHRLKVPPNTDSNIVIRIMKRRLDSSKTFGENLIFILNRASHATAEGLCVSLLILKILYLLFTTPGTHEYFYTNDLCVLIDVFVRELSDLPEESTDLRHIYLRVLHPLMTQTQLRTYSYKRREIRHVLLSHIKYAHLHEISPTTARLVQRNLHADWCFALEPVHDGLGETSWTPLRSLSADTTGSHASGGGSVVEVAASASGLVSHHPPTVLDQSHSNVSSPYPATMVCVSEVALVSGVSGPASESAPGLGRASLSLSTRSASPLSRPGSASHSPARRPAPKPPLTKRTVTPTAHPLADGCIPRLSEEPVRQSSPLLTIEKPVRRAAPSPPIPHILAEPEFVSHRRKAPLPPSLEDPRRLRGAKSSGNLDGPQNAAATWRPTHARVVSVDSGSGVDPFDDHL